MLRLDSTKFAKKENKCLTCFVFEYKNEKKITFTF